jgi:hypothetical protein
LSPVCPTGLTEAEIGVDLELMKRADLKGGEVPVYADLFNTLSRWRDCLEKAKAR